MGITKGTASANADEDRFCMFADNAPPVNYCGELHKQEVAIYGALRGLRDDFKKVAGLFIGIRDFDRRLMEVIKFSLPKELNAALPEEDDAAAMLDADMSDEGFAKALQKAVAKSANVSRMGAYLSLADALTKALESLKRKEAKLTERMRLQRNTSPEWKTACDRRVKVRDSISVLTQRRQRVAGLFFAVRDRLAREVLAATEGLLKLFTDETGAVESGYVAEMLAKNTEAAFASLAEVGRKAKEDGFAKAAKKRKGWKA